MNSSDQFFAFDRLDSSQLFHYPYFKDFDNNIFISNKIANEKMYQTFLVNQNNEVILIGSPLQNEQMNQIYRDNIDKYFNKKGISGVVKGAIITEENNMIKTRFSEAPQYFFFDGKSVSDKDAEVLIKSSQYIPVINDSTSKIILIHTDSIAMFQSKFEHANF